MITEDKWFTLKDGRKALLRNPKEEDIEGVLEYLRVSAGETEFILRYPEECEKYTYEGEKKIFEEWNSSEYDYALVCLVELEFIEGNSRARALYEKMGFRIAAVHPNFIKLKNGKLLNEYLMVKEL